jgi:hypothetical protein
MDQREGEGQTMRPLNTRAATRPLACIIALGIALAVATSAERAWAVVNVPNHVENTLTVDLAGSNSSEITVAATNSPVSVTATCLTFGQRGVGFAHVTYTPATAPQLTWNGQHANGTPSANIGTGIGTSIVEVSTGGTMRLEIGSAPNKLRVHNNSAEGGPFTIIVEQIW